MIDIEKLKASLQDVVTEGNITDVCINAKISDLEDVDATLCIMLSFNKKN